MAVSVGTAQGKLTLDATSFLKNIKESYNSLKDFLQLVHDTESQLKDLSNSEVNIKVNTSVNGGEPGSSPLGNPDDLENIGAGAGKATEKVNLLQSALNVGLTGALEGVGKVAELTWGAFEKYTKFVADFAKDSIQIGTAFDATVSKVGAISGAEGEELDSLRSKALEMGATTKFSATEAAEAMTYMGMAGWKTEQILSGVKGVMSLAAASGEDLATTSDIVTDALTAFGLQAEDSAEFANVLAAAATNSNTNVALMGESFKYVAPLAGTLKFSAEDVAIALGTMANSGIKGSQAGTALRTTLTNLLKPSKQMQEAMRAFGISMTDSEGNALDLMGTMTMLREQMGNIPDFAAEDAKAIKELSASLTQIYEHPKDALSLYGDKETMEQQKEIMEQQLQEYADKYEIASGQLRAMGKYLGGSLEQTQSAVAATIAGKYGLSGMLAIVNATDEDFQALTESIYGASEGMGAAAGMEEKMMDNLQGSVTIFKSTLETFKISVSDVLKGPANEIVKFGQGALAQLTTSLQNEGIPGLIKTVGSIIPQAVNEIVKLIPEVLPSLIEGFWALINGLIDSLPEAFPILVDAAFDLFFGLIDGFNNAASQLIPQLPELVKKLGNKLVDEFPHMLDSTVDFFLSFVEGIIQATPEIIKTIVKLIPKLIKGIKDNLNKIIQAGIDIILALIEGLTDPETVAALIEAVVEAGDLIMNTLKYIDWFDVCTKIFAGIGDALQGIFEGALTAIDGLLGTSFGDWAKEVNAFFDGLERASFDFGKTLAQSMNKTEDELNSLEAKYQTNYQDFLSMYSDLVKQGVNAQDAMAAAYQKYFNSAEAQYLFKERFAGNITGASGIGLTGWQGMSEDDLISVLSRASTVSGNTFNFYSPKAIDEKTASDEFGKTSESILRGQYFE